MDWREAEVQLVSGEKIRIVGEVSLFVPQVFVRIGNELVAGIINNPPQQGILIWQRLDDDVYGHLGNIAFRNGPEGLVEMDVLMSVDPEDEQSYGLMGIPSSN